MRRWLLNNLGFSGLLLLAALLCQGGAVARQAEARPLRLVSLAPSITETLYALGAGSQLLAVTDYCDYPAAAQGLPKVGGYYDPNFEVILSLRPDVAVLLSEHQEAAQRLRQLGVPVLVVEMHSVAGLITTYLQLGAVCGAEAKAAVLIRELLDAVSGSRDAVPPPEQRPRVLIVVSRDYQARGIHETYVAGRGEFYDELLETAGAENAYRRPWPKYPKLTVEGVMSLDPDVIIELVGDPEFAGRPLDSLADDWQQVPGWQTGRRRRVEILAGSYTVRPGPRLPLLLWDLRQALKTSQEPE
ncbi:MAG: helical backbone metal receptor [candidate division FCPU426 bacterium]